MLSLAGDRSRKGMPMGRRKQMPTLSTAGRETVDRFAIQLREQEDLRPATVRNYVSDLRHFVAWCESRWTEEAEEAEEADGALGQAGAPVVGFAPEQVTTPTLTAYRSYLQSTLGLRPASTNRALISLSAILPGRSSRRRFHATRHVLLS
jgi:integrase/recombinase XerC